MVTLVLPCLNEVEALAWIGDRTPAGMTILVADNGSTDGSQDQARAIRAEVIDVPVRGYGAAVHAGVAAARTDIVAVIDADATFDPRDLAPLIEAVESGADMATCRRVPVSATALPWHARVGNAFLCWRVRRKTALTIRDLGPARVFRRKPYLALGIEDRAFGYPMEVFVRAAAAGWDVVEVPMPYLERIGDSKVTGSPAGSLRATRALLKAMP